MYVSQEGRTALIWAAINGHKEAVEALIKKGADKDATEKVRRRYCVITGEQANMTKACLGPDCLIFALQGVSVPCTLPLALVTRAN